MSALMEKASVINNNEVVDDLLDLPPGFRFHPTDEEIITHYLRQKVMNFSFSASAIGEIDLNKCEPWDLPEKAKMGEKEWYFFFQRDRKYPTGMRTNRATESGYWKATGKDKEIYKGKNSLVGMKKTLVFYTGRAPKGEKTNWVMHEYRLEGKFSYYNLPKPVKDEWVVCRVFHKNTSTKKSPIHDMMMRANYSFGDQELIDYSSMQPLMDNIPPYSAAMSSGFYDDLDFKSMSTNYQTPIYNTNAQATLSNSNFAPNLGYLQQERTTSAISSYLMDKQCKVEQFSSNQSMVSMSSDTGLSYTEVNTEMSPSTKYGDNNNAAFLREDPAINNTNDNNITDNLDSFWDY